MGLQTAVASVDSWRQIGRREARNTQREEDGKRKWAAVVRERTEMKQERLGRSCLPFSKAGLGYLYDVSESVAIQCTLRREGNWGGEKEGKREYPGGDRLRSVVCERSPVFR